MVMPPLEKNNDLGENMCAGTHHADFREYVLLSGNMLVFFMQREIRTAKFVVAVGLECSLKP